MRGNYIAGLGITASHVRAISDGRVYDRFFPSRTIGTDPIVNRNAEVHDTLHFVARIVATTLGDTKAIALQLNKHNLIATLENVFNFFYDNYQYKLDKEGREQVRRPARAWLDRKQGIDCDCFTTSVSSVLTNLGIPHSLKIIGIKGRSYFQHIYVVVPKFKGADLTKRMNYWVIDPVLNRFDEEAPEITKADFLDMSNVNGIPLQYLNGVDSQHRNMANRAVASQRPMHYSHSPLGTEFDDMDQVNGLGNLSDGDDVLTGFKKRLHAHVGKTKRHIQNRPSAVSTVYQPAVLVGMLGELETALAGPDSELDAKLESLSNREHLCYNPRFQGCGNALHTHDDFLYGEIYGDLDDSMIGALLGSLGDLGKSAAKKAKQEQKKQDKAAKKADANQNKKGVFTKVKNAVKVVAKATKNAAKATGKTVATAAKKTGKAIATATKVAGKAVATAAKTSAKAVAKVAKKVGKAIVKNNPVSLAARAGFLVAMRTNFMKIAEKAYWGYQTQQQAIAAKVSVDYYNRCKQLLDKIRKVFIGTLKGEESTLKKAILNGRAAKKISKNLKGLGYTQGFSMLFGLEGGQYGLGDPATATAITASLSFLTPIFTWIKSVFKKKKADGSDGVETETGAAEDAASTDPSTVQDTLDKEASNPSNSVTAQDDGSAQAAEKANDEGPSSSQAAQDGDTGAQKYNTAPGSSTTLPTNTSNDSSDSEGTKLPDTAKPKTASAGGSWATGIIALICGGVFLSRVGKNKGKGKGDKPEKTEGLGNWSGKRESKKLQKVLNEKGVRLDKGYAVSRKKQRKIQTLKLS